MPIKLSAVKQVPKHCMVSTDSRNKTCLSRNSLRPVLRRIIFACSVLLSRIRNILRIINYLLVTHIPSIKLCVARGCPTSLPRFRSEKRVPWYIHRCEQRFRHHVSRMELRYSYSINIFGLSVSCPLPPPRYAEGNAIGRNYHSILRWGIVAQDNSLLVSVHNSIIT